MTTQPRNPWLDIPLRDYEEHMALPSVGQAELLGDVLAEACRTYAPQSVAVIGCAGGNGFDRVPDSVERLVGIDINPSYIAAARERFASLPSLELHVADLAGAGLPFAPVELAFAALVLEYVEPARALASIAAKLAPAGRLVVVLQLPSDVPEVTPSPYRSLEALGGTFRLVTADDARAAGESCGLCVLGIRTTQARGGKRFAVLVFGSTAPR